MPDNSRRPVTLTTATGEEVIVDDGRCSNYTLLAGASVQIRHHESDVVTDPVISVSETAAAGNWTIFGPGTQKLLSSDATRQIEQMLSHVDSVDMVKSRGVYWLELKNESSLAVGWPLCATEARDTASTDELTPFAPLIGPMPPPRPIPAMRQQLCACPCDDCENVAEWCSDLCEWCQVIEASRHEGLRNCICPCDGCHNERLLKESHVDMILQRRADEAAGITETGPTSMEGVSVFRIRGSASGSQDQTASGSATNLTVPGIQITDEIETMMQKMHDVQSRRNHVHSRRRARARPEPDDDEKLAKDFDEWLETPTETAYD